MPIRGTRAPKAPVGDAQDPDSLYYHLLRYLAFLEEKNYSPHTLETRGPSLRLFISWCFDRGVTRPQQLDRATMEQYQRHLFHYRKADGKPIAIITQEQRIIPLRHWFQWLVKQGRLTFSPATDLELPRREQRLPKAVLSAREAESVLAVPDVGTTLGLRDRAILETLYSTGIRRLELIRLNLHDLDYERGTVMVRQGKGRKDRLVPIGNRALLWIAAYCDRARPELVNGRDDGTLFLTSQGEPITRDWVTRIVRSAVVDSGVGKPGSCHLFRHTAATLMLENGADIRFIQQYLGHVNLNTTQIYARVSIQKLKAIHTATHPGSLPDGAHQEAEPEPTEDDLMAALALEEVEESEV